MKRLIITADDFGMSPAVNQAIVEGISKGLISTTNVMTNMEYCADIDQLMIHREKISIGLHWTLTAGRPVSEPHKVSSLVNKSTGEFWSYAEFRKRFKVGYIKKEEIITELKAQYDKFVDVFGFIPDYWNTHQNTHVAIKLYNLFLDLAKELEIYCMRTHQRIYVPAKIKTDFSLKQQLLEPLKRYILRNWQNKAKKVGMFFPDGLIVNLDEKERSDIEYTLSNIGWKNTCCGEYVIHPATKCDSKFFGKIVDKRIEEYKQFSDEKTLSVIKNIGLSIVNFNNIK